MSETIGELFRSHRHRRALTIREAAKLLDTGYGHLCQVERGEHFNLTVRTLLRAQKVYGISDRQLLASARESLKQGEPS